MSSQYGLSASCRQDFTVGDPYEFLSYKLNPALAELAARHGKALKPMKTSRLTMWVNEYDGARVQVNYTGEDVDPGSFIVSMLYTIRDGFVEHRISFQDMRNMMARTITSFIERHPEFTIDLIKLLHVLDCNLIVAGRPLEHTGGGTTRVKLVFHGVRNRLSDWAEVTTIYNNGGRIVSESRTVDVRRKRVILEVPSYSILAVSVGPYRRTIAVGDSSETVHVNVGLTAGVSGIMGKLKYVLLAVLVLVLAVWFLLRSAP